MNLAEMIAVVRAELKDETGELWDDSELTRHIGRAVNELSMAIPLAAAATVATTAGSREIDVSGLSGRVMIEAVEYPAGAYPGNYVRFSLWGESLTLVGEDVPDGSDCRIYYGRLHSIDAAGSTVPERYHELIACGASGYAATAWSVYAINRVNVGTASVPGDYLAWGRERLRFFYRELGRLGRKNRVRCSRLYSPGGERPSGVTDYGP